MSDSDYVQVNLVVRSSSIAVPGFKKPLIVSHNAPFDGTRAYNIASSIASVLEDFAADSPEAIAARQIASQSPHPTEIAIGSALGEVIQRYDLMIEDVRPEHTYQLRVSGEGFDETVVEFESDDTATNDEIVAGLVSALNLVANKNYTASAVVDASGPSDMLRIVGNAAGDWFSVEVLDLTAMSIAQTHGDFDVEEDLAALLDVDSSWYWIVTLYNSKDYVKTVAAWAEANGRAYLPELVESAAITEAYDEETSTDAIAEITGLSYKATMPMYHGKPAQMLGAALTGLLAALPIGTWTAALKTVVGVTPSTFSATQRTNLTNRRGNGYEVAFGRSVTFDGMVGNEDFGFLDNKVGLDALVADLKAALFGVKVGSNKVAATPEDIVKLESAAKAVLQRYSSPERPVLKRDDALKVFTPTLDDFNAATRTLSNFRVQGALANAVQHTVVDLTVTN